MPRTITPVSRFNGGEPERQINNSDVIHIRQAMWFIFLFNKLFNKLLNFI